MDSENKFADLRELLGHMHNLAEFWREKALRLDLDVDELERQNKNLNAENIDLQQKLTAAQTEFQTKFDNSFAKVQNLLGDLKTALEDVEGRGGNKTNLPDIKTKLGKLDKIDSVEKLADELRGVKTDLQNFSDEVSELKKLLAEKTFSAEKNLPAEKVAEENISEECAQEKNSGENILPQEGPSDSGLFPQHNAENFSPDAENFSSAEEVKRDRNMDW